MTVSRLWRRETTPTSAPAAPPAAGGVWVPNDPAHGPQPEAADAAEGAKLSFPGVCLLSQGPDEPGPVGDVRLDVDDALGLALEGADGASVWSATWADLAVLATPERLTMADGKAALVVVATTGTGQSHHFVVPSPRPRRLERELRAVAARHGVRCRRSAPPVAVTAVVVLAVAAAVTALLLAAGHVIRL